MSLRNTHTHISAYHTATCLLVKLNLWSIFGKANADIQQQHHVRLFVLHQERVCFLCTNDTDLMRTYRSIQHCPGDAPLIRSDNTVRNEISTIVLQSFSFLVKRTGQP